MLLSSILRNVCHLPESGVLGALLPGKEPEGSENALLFISQRFIKAAAGIALRPAEKVPGQLMLTMPCSASFKGRDGTDALIEGVGCGPAILAIAASYNFDATRRAEQC